MPKGFRFRMGSFIFYYAVLTEDHDLGVDFELDLIGVWYNGDFINDGDMDAIDCEKIYDRAFNEFKKEYL